MPIGDSWPAEWKTFVDDETGRTIRQYTTAAARSYPLYYFIPSITDDGRYLVFYSERTGWVQMFRLDLRSGEIVQLTEATTVDSGWAIWCEYHLRGVFNHISVLNTVRREVYFYADEELYCSDLDSLAVRCVRPLPGRIPTGQGGFSPDGRLFAFTHADSTGYRRSLANRDALINIKRAADGELAPHDDWQERRGVPSTVTILDTETGDVVRSVDFDHQATHVVFADKGTLVGCSHTPEPDLWALEIEGGTPRHIRPPDQHGRANHFVVTGSGIVYEAIGGEFGGKPAVWLGRYDLGSDSWDEWRLPPTVRSVHVGKDPSGVLFFIDCYVRDSGDRDQHCLMEVDLLPDGTTDVRLLRTLTAFTVGQRQHAHPFLSPDRQALFYTEVMDGYSQICSLDAGQIAVSEE